MRDWILGGTMALAALGLAACVQDNGPAPDDKVSIDQSRLCQVSTWKPLAVASECEPGQKALYRPGDDGSAETAALFAAANCDLRYSVAVSPGGTACIYRPIRSASALSPDDQTADSG